MGKQMIYIGMIIMAVGASLVPIAFIYAIQTSVSHPGLFVGLLVTGFALVIAGFTVWLVGKTKYLADTNAPPEAYVLDTRPKHLR
jgi:hypothetical protein